MQRKLFIGIMMMVFVVGILTTVSCAKKTVKSDQPVNESEKETPAALPPQAVVAENEEVKDDGLSPVEPRSIGEERFKDGQRYHPEDSQRNETVGRKTFLDELVLFDFDSTILTAAAQDRLKRKAQWLTDNQEVSIIIQGHCDERGTNLYNLSLGEMRIQAVKAFLVDLGITAARLSSVSYGEERPFVTGHDEGSWKLNRRAHFVIE
jgi:peptidoglycan-associated lipoprotein